jgi:hypothetical protein
MKQSPLCVPVYPARGPFKYVVAVKILQMIKDMHLFYSAEEHEEFE